MIRNLDALIAAANRAQQACDHKLGNCSRVLHIGLFFDGVGRNIDQDAVEKRLSNIARLFRAYPDEESRTYMVVYKKYYISGLGTPFDEVPEEKLLAAMDISLGSLLDDIKGKPADMAKDALHSTLEGESGKDVLTEVKDKLLTPKGRLGLLKDSATHALKRVGIEATPWLRDSEFMAYNFLTGVETRLNSLKARFAQSYHEAASSSEVPVRLISVSLFGYDLGATLARKFLDILLNDMCRKGADGQHTWQSVPVDIVFTGLFDCSRDTPESSDDGLDYAASVVSWLPGPVAKTAAAVGSMYGRKYLDHMSPLPQAVKKSLHLVAAHERRPWRCVYRTGLEGDSHREELMPGCSEDIGGGLKPGVQKPSAELSRVPLRRMYQEAMKAGVPFPDFNTLDEYNPVIAAYFAMQNGVQHQSAAQWVNRYQRSVPDRLLSYRAMNRHLDSYFEWLGQQHYQYKSELRRLERQEQDTLLSAGASAGLLGTTPLARQAADDVKDELAILKKHWGWLSDVVNAADLLLTRKFYSLPETYRIHILEPALVRATYFNECGTAGYDGAPLPIMWYHAPSELYAWFVHDVQPRGGISDAYFCVRWMEAVQSPGGLPGEKSGGSGAAAG